MSEPYPEGIVENAGPLHDGRSPSGSEKSIGAATTRPPKEPLRSGWPVSVLTLISSAFRGRAQICRYSQGAGPGDHGWAGVRSLVRLPNKV